MIEPASPYDEIGSRTRQSWLRTGLGAVAVSLLVLRGLALGDARPWVMAVSVLPGAAFVALTVMRMRRLQHGKSPGLPAVTTILAFAIVCGIAVAAAASVAGGTS
jgi:hypothetical protein